jgi:iron complex outermembrane recepter protein
MFKKTKVCTGLMLAFGGTFGMSAFPVFAQQQLDKVEITGSNIRRVDSESSSAVQTVTREEIERSGKGSVAQLLQTLAVDNQGSVPTTFGNGFAAGASGISLRGLGAASTLVLVNGRRIAPYGLADDGQKVFSDLNMIPLEAVDRIEILKDGASAIYGSDAIAGVVNVILRRDFTGTVAKASYGSSAYGDGAEKRVAITHGFGNLETDKYNILLNLELGKKGEIWYKDRASRNQVGRIDLRDLGFSAQEALGGTGAILDNNLAASAINGNVRNPATNDYFNRGNQNTAATGFTQNFPNADCANFTSHRQGDPLGGCLIDGTQVYGQVQPSEETTNLFARGTLQIYPGMQAYAEGNFFKSKSQSFTTPSRC